MILPEEIPNLYTISDGEAEAFCAKMRTALVDGVSRTGGHLASNLGAVELTVALHRVFDFADDRLVFDVGHQCYTHKILTGRADVMDTLRSFGGIAGFPKPTESPCDAFIAGHASNSVSVAVGMARARTLLGANYDVIALLGDGALTGGLAYEGLSDAGSSGEKLIVILNDNGMSITKSVGGVAEHLARQRLRPQYLRFKKGYRAFMNAVPGGKAVYRVTHKIKKAVKETLLPCSLFEDMGFTYLGPVDGHDVRGLTRLLRYTKDIQTPVLLHVRTVKGKGYAPAEDNPDLFHGVGRFCVRNGEPLSKGGANFSSAFGEALCDLAEEDARICAVTAAMLSGTGLEDFSQRFPTRFFDVGIAEGHAVAMAAGMAKQGMTPVFAVYSTFLQRAYDMLIHDVAIQHLHVVLAVDRAGVVGEDGETHHGIFDAAFLNSVPGMTVLCPSSHAETKTMLAHAVRDCSGPVALRYPRGGEGRYQGDSGSAGTVVVREGESITLVGYGILINQLLECADLLAELGISVEVVKLNTITPLDLSPVLASVQKTGRLLVAEDVVAAGGVGQRLCAALAQEGVMPKGLALCNFGDAFVTHGSVPELYALHGLDGNSLCEKAREVCGHG